MKRCQFDDSYTTLGVVEKMTILAPKVSQGLRHPTVTVKSEKRSFLFIMHWLTMAGRMRHRNKSSRNTSWITLV